MGGACFDKTKNNHGRRHRSEAEGPGGFGGRRWVRGQEILEGGHPGAPVRLLTDAAVGLRRAHVEICHTSTVETYRC